MAEIDEDGLKAARRYAGWHIGDPVWADYIIRAYLNPERANDELDREGVPERTGAYR